MSKETKKPSNEWPTQKALKNWIHEWKKCRCSELPDVFQILLEEDFADPNQDRSYFYRLQAYFLNKKYWTKLFSEETYRVRVHFAVFQPSKKAKLAPNNQKHVIPIIQSSKMIGKIEKFGKLYAFSPVLPVVGVGMAISAELNNQLTNNWLYLHPGYLADQFESVKEEAEKSDNKYKGTLKPSERKRVNHYTYSKEDVDIMRGLISPKNQKRENKSKVKEVYFRLGVNHHDDRNGVPSFAPILHFVKNKSKTRTLGTLPNENDLFFEFATPCPHLCS